jgi:hypothetical protein
MNYKKYLESDEWKRKRKELIAQSNGICEHSKNPVNPKKMQIHHKSYSNLGHESRNELEVVSEYTHKQIHRRDKHAITKTREERKRSRIY